jgi:hypothetical protein
MMRVMPRRVTRLVHACAGDKGRRPIASAAFVAFATADKLRGDIQAETRPW